MPGVAGQVYIDILSRDKMNLKDVGKGMGKAGRKAGEEFGKEWYRGVSKDFYGISQSLLRSFQVALTGTGSPFTVVINEMYSNGLKAGMMFAKGFGKVTGDNMSRNVQNINKNIRNLGKYNNYPLVGKGYDSDGNLYNKYGKRIGAPGSQFTGRQYYLLNPKQQESFRKNHANFLDQYGTGGPMFARIAGLGSSWKNAFDIRRAYRANTFNRQAYEYGLFNNKKNRSLFDAIQYNATKATGGKGHEFQYVGKGWLATHLGESFNRRLATPDTLSYLLSNNINKRIANGSLNKDSTWGQLQMGLASSVIHADAGIRTALPVLIKGIEGTATTALASALSGAGIAGQTFYKGVQAYAEPEYLINRMRARASTGEDIDSVARKAREVAGELSNITVQQMTQTAENMQKAGWSAADIVKALPAVGMGANAMDMAPDQLVNDLVSVGNIFHIDPNDWGNMMQVLAKATNASPMKFEDVIAYLRQAGTNAYNGGSSLNDALADMLVLEEATGIQWGANLGTLGRSMQRGVITNADFLQDLGVSMFNEKGEQRGGTDLGIAIAKALRENNPNLSTAQANLAAQKIYGSYGARGAGIGNAEIGDFKKYYDIITNEDDLLTDLANASRMGIKGTTGFMSSKLDVLYNNIGESVAPGLQRVMDLLPPAVEEFGAKFQPVVDKFNDWTSSLDESTVREFISKFIDNMVTLEERGVDLIQRISEGFFQYMPGIMQGINAIIDYTGKFANAFAEIVTPLLGKGFKKGQQEWVDKGGMIQSIVNRVSGVGGEKNMLVEEKNLADFAKQLWKVTKSEDNRTLKGKIWDGLSHPIKSVMSVQDRAIGNDPFALSQKNFLNELASKDSAMQARARRYFYDDKFVTPQGLLDKYNITHEELKARVKSGMTVSEALNAIMPNLTAVDNLLKKTEQSTKEVGGQVIETPENYDPNFTPKDLFKSQKAGPANEKVGKPLSALGPKEEKPGEVPYIPESLFGNPLALGKRGFVADMALHRDVEVLMPKRDEKGNIVLSDQKDEYGNQLPVMEIKLLQETLGRTNELLFDTNDEVEKLANLPEGTIAKNTYTSKEDTLAFVRERLGQDGRLWSEHMLSENSTFVSDMINQVMDRYYSATENFSLENLEDIVQKIYDAMSDRSESDMRMWTDDLTGKTYFMSAEQYQNGGYLDVNKDREQYEKAMKKKKKTLSPEEQAERDAERERKAELRAQREFEKNKLENSRKFEKWKIESQRKWEESMQKAQMANDEAVSGSLGGLDKVFGFDNNYSTEKDWVKAIVPADLTGQTAKQILANRDIYGTVNPFEVARQKTMLNFQELAQRDMEKMMQEERATEMWYEYLQAVTAGGTVSKFEISDSALSFQFQNVPKVEVKDSDVRIEAGQVVAELGKDIKEDLKKIVDYCEDQSQPIAV